MHRISTFAAIGAICLTLGACAKTDQQVISSSCVKEGNEKPFCDCLAETMETSLSPNVYGKIVNSMRDDGKSREEAENDLSVLEKTELLVLFPKTFACAGAE